MKRLVKNIKGVTLIELIVVVTIIGIAAAIAAPGMSGWLAKAKLNAEARKIYSAFQLARSEAIKENHDVCLGIVFNSGYGTSTYTVKRGTYTEYGSSTTIYHATTTVPKGLRLYMSAYPTYTGLTTWQYTSRGTFLSGDEGQTLILMSDSSALTSPNNYKTFTFTLGGGVEIN